MTHRHRHRYRHDTDSGPTPPLAAAAAAAASSSSSSSSSPHARAHARSDSDTDTDTTISSCCPHPRAARALRSAAGCHRLRQRNAAINQHCFSEQCSNKTMHRGPQRPLICRRNQGLRGPLCATVAGPTDCRLCFATRAVRNSCLGHGPFRTTA